MSTDPPRSHLPLLLLLVTAILLSAFTFDHGLVMFDEGHRLAYAERILAGERIYRDFWSVYAPAQFYLIAGVLEGFGRDLLVVRLLWVVVRVGTSLALFRASLRLLSPPLAFLATLVWLLVPGHLHKAFFVFFPVVGLLIVLRVAEGKSAPWQAGLLSAVALLFRYDVGVFTAVLFWGMLASSTGTEGEPKGSSPLRRLPPRVSAGLEWSLAFLLLLGVALPFFGVTEMWTQVRIQARVIGGGVSRVSIPYPSLTRLLDAPLGWEGFRVLLFYVPLVVYAGGAFLLFRCSGSVRRALALFLLLSLCLFNQVFWQSNLAHFLQATPLVPALLLFLIVSGMARLRRRWRSCLLPLAVGGCLAPFLYFHLFVCEDPATGSLAMRRFMKGRLSIPHARVVYFSARIAEIEETVRTIERLTRPEEPIFVFPQDALYYFLARRKNATPYDYYLPGMFRHFGGEGEERVVERLRSHPPALFVYTEPATYLGAPRGKAQRFSHDAPRIWRYLVGHARLAAEIQNTLVFRIVPEETPAMIPFMTGYEAMKYGDVSGAIEAFSTAIAMGGAEAHFHAHLGSALLAASRCSEAEGAFAQALRLDPANQRALSGMARCAGLAGRWGEAVALLSRLRPLPETPDYPLQLGVAQRNLGELPASIETLSAAVRRFPDHFPLLEQLGRSLLAAGQAAEAETVFRRLGKIAGVESKRRRQSALLLAEARLAQGNDPRAIRRLLRLIEQDPRDLAPYDPLIEAWCRTGEFDRANRLLESGASHAETRSERVTFLEWFGQVARAAGELDRAAGLWESALEMAPPSRKVRLALMLGDLLLSMGQPRKAAALFSAVFENDPTHPRAPLKLAQALRSAGDLEAAVTLLESLVDRFPERGEIERLLGRIALEAGRWEEARYRFEHLLSRDPRDREAHLSLGIVLRKEGKLAAAEAHLATAVTLDPEDPTAHLQLGITLAAQKRYTSARMHLQRALSLDPSNVEARYRIALTYLAERRFAEARKFLEEILAIDPDHARARRKLEALPLPSRF